jgi:hypothetical protein
MVDKRTIKLFAMVVGILLSGCASNANNETVVKPGQLVTRAIETRFINADFETTYKAVQHSFTALGYTISHSEKSSGLLVADRTQKNNGRMAYATLGLGLLAFAVDNDHTEEITIIVEKKSDEKTKIRIQMITNGKPQIDPVTVDTIWVVTQRETMLIRGLTIDDEINSKYETLKDAKYIK